MDTFSPVFKESTPHIYVSALTFCPQSWPLRKHSKYSNGLNFSFPHEINWEVVRDKQELAYSAAPLSLSSDGTRVLFPTGEGISIKDTRTGDVCFDPNYKWHSRRDAFCCNDQRVVSFSESEVRMWDPCTAETLWAHPLENSPHTDESVMRIVPPDGQYVAYYIPISVNLRKTIYRLYILKTNALPDEKSVCILERSKLLSPLILFSVDGTKLLYSTDSEKRVWDTVQASWSLMDQGESRWEGDEWDQHAAFSNDSSVVATSSKKGVRIWHTAPGQFFKILEAAATKGVCFTSNAQYVVSTDGNRLQIWNVAVGSLYKEFTLSRGTWDPNAWGRPTLKLSDDFNQFSVAGYGFLLEWTLDKTNQQVNYVSYVCL